MTTDKLCKIIKQSGCILINNLVLDSILLRINHSNKIGISVHRANNILEYSSLLKTKLKLIGAIIDG